ncbi:hypothetical protein ONZ45_g16800 [Pleurotus djamor]|nr:hypothetical protein ONZ45_g16800 [Pleurotus djamor]
MQSCPTITRPTALGYANTHRDSQQTPVRLRVKAPEFQLSKEFEESVFAGAGDLRKAFTDSTAIYQETIVNAALIGKNKEVLFWDNKVDPNNGLTDLAALAGEIWKANEPRYRLPTVMKNAAGESVLSGEWTTSTQRVAEHRAMLRIGHLLCTQTLAIIQRHHDVMAKKIEKKKEVAQKASDAMDVDQTRPGPSIQSLVDKALNARMKKLQLAPAKNKNSGQSTAKKQTPPPKTKKDRQIKAQEVSRKVEAAKAANAKKIKSMMKGEKRKRAESSTSGSDKKGKRKAN